MTTIIILSVVISRTATECQVHILFLVHDVAKLQYRYTYIDYRLCVLLFRTLLGHYWPLECAEYFDYVEDCRDTDMGNTQHAEESFYSTIDIRLRQRTSMACSVVMPTAVVNGRLGRSSVCSQIGRTYFPYTRTPPSSIGSASDCILYIPIDVNRYK